MEKKLFDDLARRMREAQAISKDALSGAWPRTPHARSWHWPWPWHWPTSTDNG